MAQQVLDETVKQAIKQFTEMDEKICHFTNILGLLGWDARTYAPKKGKPIFAKAKGTLSTETFKLSVSKEMGECLDTLSQPDVFEQLDSETRACVRERKKEYDKSKQIPSDVYNEYVILASNANDAWEEARAKDDFSHFQPYLEKMIDMKRRFAEYFGYEKHPYDALLDEFEPGLTVEKLDPLFCDLRKKSIELLNRIQQSPRKPRNDIFNQNYDVEKQKEFAQFIIGKLGYDLDAGRLDETTHPFAMGINTGDVRITTRYEPENPRMAVFGTIHETGHALYEQGVNSEYEGRVIRRGSSFGIHESQSRFLENFVGRTKEFWTYFYDDIKAHFPHQLSGVSLEEFYRAVNCVEPSLIRVEADELTYNLHIMLRYEIEKGLIAGDIEVKDLPKVWNDKMMDYLGVIPPSNRLGVLQDVHWSHGGVGYFPSYSLGNLYGAQILNKVLQELPDFYELIQNGEFMKIREWLRENVHQYGKLYTPAELIKKVTGEDLDAKYLTDYLEQKFTKLYDL
ncbi:carboxypeptidase M32 [Pseudalkalibacillus sp. R45]|uniref:carboxypeptidase M32 n=1 Tax=Pseudalkalibacillus sp. R45 TaxID=3457433 RepID=UPI003FCE7EB2